MRHLDRHLSESVCTCGDTARHLGPTDLWGLYYQTRALVATRDEQVTMLQRRGTSLLDESCELKRHIKLALQPGGFDGAWVLEAQRMLERMK